MFSVSTNGGVLDENNLDFQSSISDDSLENGEIVVLKDLAIDEIVWEIKKHSNGEYA